MPILLKKSFSVGGRNFLAPLARFARGDVRDHIVSHENDHQPSYPRSFDHLVGVGAMITGRRESLDKALRVRLRIHISEQFV